MKIAIVDDVAVDRDSIKGLIERYGKEHGIRMRISLYESGELLLLAVAEEAFDVVFMDVYMDGLDGMQTAKELRKISEECLIIFSTSSRQHAVESFRVRAFDYLVKPYTYESFHEVMSLCCSTLNERGIYIELKEGRVVKKVLLDDIIFVDYSNHYVYLHTKEGVIKSYMSFPLFYSQLEQYPQFLQCYRNCAINMDEVSGLDDRDFLMSTGERIPISRNKVVEMRQRYADYTFERLERGTLF